MQDEELLVFLDFIDSYKLRYLRKNQSCKDHVDAELVLEHAAVDWGKKPPVVECKITKGTPGARRLKKQWKANVKAKLQNVVDQIEVRTTGVNHEYWAAMLDEMKNMQVSHPKDICIIQEKDNEKVVIVGGSDVMDQSFKEIKSAIEKAIKIVKESKEKVTKSEKIKPYQARYLFQSDFNTTMTSKFKNVKIKVVPNYGKVTIVGRKSEVEQCWSEMKDIIRSIRTKTVELEPEHVKLLVKRNVEHVIGTKMSQMRLTNIWEVEKDEVSVYADTDEDLDKMENVITNALGKVTTQLDARFLSALKSDKWKLEEMNLKEKLDGCLVAKLDDNRKTFEVFMLADNEDEVSDMLNKFCSKNAIYKETMPVDPPIVKLMDNYMFKDILDKMDRLRDQEHGVKYKFNTKGTVEFEGK